MINVDSKLKGISNMFGYPLCVRYYFALMIILFLDMLYIKLYVMLK